MNYRSRNKVIINIHYHNLNFNMFICQVLAVSVDAMDGDLRFSWDYVPVGDEH